MGINSFKTVSPSYWSNLEISFTFLFRKLSNSAFSLKWLSFNFCNSISNFTITGNDGDDSTDILVTFDANIIEQNLKEVRVFLRYPGGAERDTVGTINGDGSVSFVITLNPNAASGDYLIDRFIIVEMDVLAKTEEAELLRYLYPNLDTDSINAISGIVADTRTEMGTEAPRISTHISTRASVEMAGLIYDGFTIEEAAMVLIYPQYDNAGGLDSERTFVKQIVQKYIPTDANTDDLFNVESEDPAE